LQTIQNFTSVEKALKSMKKEGCTVACTESYQEIYWQLSNS
jgi:hypothetical protein